MLTFVGFLLAYAGFTALCAVAKRSTRLVWTNPPAPALVWWLRVVGFSLIALAWLPCYLAWETWPMGTMAWGCLISVAALILILPFTYYPRKTVIIGGVAAIPAAVLSVALLLPYLLQVSPTVAAGPAPDVAAGKALWEGNGTQCKNCHGRDGEGQFGPDLAGRGLSAAQFKAAVRKPWGIMPAYTEDQLNDADIINLTAYFNTLPETDVLGLWRVPISAEATHGEKLYQAAGCAQCHGRTFDIPRSFLGGRNGDFALMKDLVYAHTTTMPKFDAPPGRLRMGNFDSMRLSEDQLKEIYDWAHDVMGFRPALQAQFVAGEGGNTYVLTLVNNGEEGKGLTAEGLTVNLVIPVGITVIAATGDGYKGVHMDPQLESDVAEWQIAHLAPKDTTSLTVTLSQAPANLKGTIRWVKPAPKDGPSLDVMNFAVRAAGGR